MSAQIDPSVDVAEAEAFVEVIAVDEVEVETLIEDRHVATRDHLRMFTNF